MLRPGAVQLHRAGTSVAILGELREAFGHAAAAAQTCAPAAEVGRGIGQSADALGIHVSTMKEVLRGSFSLT